MAKDEVVPVEKRELKVWVKCYHCGYEWETGGNLGFVTCPNCMKKVKRDMARLNYLKVHG